MYAKVALDQALDRLLDYAVPSHLRAAAKEGSRVTVPLRGHPRKGTIISLSTSTIHANVVAIETVDEHALSPDLLQLAEWMTRYYAAPMSKVLLTLLPSVVRNDIGEKEQWFIQSSLSKPKLAAYAEEIRMKWPKQAAVLDVLLRTEGLLLSELLEEVSRGPLDSLLKKGVLEKTTVRLDRSHLNDEEFLPSQPKQLTDQQQQALSGILQGGVHLLHGITGSGKTEVYLQAIAHTLSQGKQAILLVPEIALTRQTIERLKSRFQTKIAVMHHRISKGERFDLWHQMRKGEISIAIGARSAVFAPMPNLGLIVVDEEHESSYKQFEEAPCYHARDIAVVRGKLCQATVILGSATPCAESYWNAMQRKYTLHELTSRPSGAPPQVHIVDMNAESNNGSPLLSDLLLKKMKEKISVGEQVILFLNRRGYYACQVCKACKKAITCSHCDMSLTFHRGQNILSCHICGFTLKPPIETCPSCHKQETLKFQGPGTEQVERAIHALFPGIRTLRMDRDTTKHKGSHDRIFQEFRTGKADVLIGTQMLAKGLHFPAVTLVGILGADHSLYIPDFRANEQTYQLISQVAGRSGRGQLPGEVIIQSFLFDHPVIHLAAQNNYKGFIEKELEERKSFGYPPFIRLLKLTFHGKDPKQTFAAATRYLDQLRPKLPPNYTLLPLATAGKAKIKDTYRFQALLKGPNPLAITPLLPPAKHVLIDVDPLSTY